MQVESPVGSGVVTLPRAEPRAYAEHPALPREASFRLRIAAEELMLRRPADHPGRIARALRRAVIDLNPHQVEAAVAALGALNERGLILADEVGLGKTIEAGLVLAQLLAEGKGRLLVLTPATLRKQWALELESKLGLGSVIVDGPSAWRDERAGRTAFDHGGRIVIASHPFAARRPDELRAIRWDAVVIDEAHRLRGAHRGSKTARALREALENRPKLLLTATPLQNGLGELYGILSFLDHDLLGSFDEFRRMYPDALDVEAAGHLRTRVRPHIHRTLRRQVKEYIRYTERKSIVAEFTPTPDEARLYEGVSAYLAEPETFALDPARRPLMVMVYRKLLASSPAAIAGTLAALAESLRGRIDRGDVAPEAEDADAEALYEDLSEELGDDRTKEDRPRPPPTQSRLEGEVGRLESLAALARSITRPAKMLALLSAIERAFVDATARGWPKKAVIFTESRRTQDALFAALEEAGHAGRVMMMHGGSGNADARDRIIEAFRNEGRILLLTEAGAEGLNLQFANLVVNYDLPWNPQRIEQRIGRCHRYGQNRDVVVLNFLSRDNAAEARLYELLAKKLELFDGVFGATDEPLGALGDGAEFERRVFDIFQSCREETEIKAAFDALQAELDDRIQARMREARAKICDHFDDEIKNRLRFVGNATGDALDRDEQALLTLVRGALPGATLDADGRLHLPDGAETLETSHHARQKGAHFLTVDHPVAAPLIARMRKEPAAEVRYVVFDYTRNNHRISRLAPLLGSEGWWLVYRLSFDGALGEDHLVHVVMMRTPEGETVILDEAQIESLLEIHARDVEKRPRLRAATLASTHAEAALEPRVGALEAEAKGRATEARRRAEESIELGLEDALAALRVPSAAAETSWKRARESGDRAEVQRAARELERALEREATDRRIALGRRSHRLAELEGRGGVSMNRTLVATAYFWLE